MGAGARRSTDGHATRRGYRVRNRLGPALAGVVAVLLVGTATACAAAVDRDPSSAPPVSGSPIDATGTREAGVYVQVLRRYLSTPAENSFPERTFQRIFVLDRAVPGSGEPQAQRAAGEPIPAGTQQAMLGALRDLGPVSFVADRDSVIVMQDGCAVVKDDGILITLAPISGAGDRVEVGVNGYVACLGATWLTYVVTYTSGSGWQVTGTTGSMAIS